MNSTTVRILDPDCFGAKLLEVNTIQLIVYENTIKASLPRDKALLTRAMHLNTGVAKWIKNKGYTVI